MKSHAQRPLLNVEGLDAVNDLAACSWDSVCSSWRTEGEVRSRNEKNGMWLTCCARYCLVMEIRWLAGSNVEDCSSCRVELVVL